MPLTAIDDLVLQRSRFLRFVQRRVDSRDTAEDIIQSAYVRAVEQSASLRSEESAVAWFYRILRNAVIDHYRRRTTEDRALTRWAQDLVAECRTDARTREIACEFIGEVLLDLRPSYREIIREVDLGGRSLESFAVTNGITAGNAAVRAHRARLALRKRMVEVCRACAENGCEECACLTA